MKHLKNLTLLALVPALFALAPAPAKIEFGPQAGTTLTKTFTHKMELTLDGMSMLINGQEAPGMPEMDMTMAHHQVITVTDKFGTVRDGKPLTLRRTFDELGMDMNMAMMISIMGQDNEQNQDMEGSSELEGKTVVFTWDADEGEHVKAFAEGSEGEEELLEGLEEDMDLRGLLPPGDVSEGETWSIEPRKLVVIMAPGGNLQILPDVSDVDMEMMGMGGGMNPSFNDLFGDVLEGEASGTFLGMREVDGRRCAAIKITMDIASSNDLTEMVKAALEEMELPIEAEFEIEHMELEFESESEGTLLWDVAAGHFHSIELSGDLRILIDQSFTLDMQGQSMAMEQTIEMSGTMSMTAGVE